MLEKPKLLTSYLLTISILLFLGCDSDKGFEWGDTPEEIESKVGNLERVDTSNIQGAHLNAVSSQGEFHNAERANVLGVEAETLFQFNGEQGLCGFIQIYHTDELTDGVSSVQTLYRTIAENEEHSVKEPEECTVEEAENNVREMRTFIDENSFSAFREEMNRVFKAGYFPAHVCRETLSFGSRNYNITLKPIVEPGLNDFKLKIYAYDESREDPSWQSDRMQTLQ